MSEVFRISLIYICTALVHLAICPMPLLLQHSSLSNLFFQHFSSSITNHPFFSCITTLWRFHELSWKLPSVSSFLPSYKRLRRIISKWGGGNILFLCLLISTFTLEAMATKYFIFLFFFFFFHFFFLTLVVVFFLSSFASISKPSHPMLPSLLILCRHIAFML